MSQLSSARLAAFAAPCLPMAALGVPITLYLPQFYAGEMGLGLAAVGAIFMLARLWDGVSDPLMGWISDRFPTRWGRRRPWVAAATPIVCVAAWFLFLPAGQVSPGYLLGWLLALYVGWTMLTIPHLSWAAELSGDYHQRSRIQAFREAAEIVGVPLLLALPALIEAFGGETVARQRLAAMGLFVIVLLPLAVTLTLRLTPEPVAPPRSRLPLRRAIGALAANRALRRLVLADAVSGAGGAAVGALFVYVATEAWGLGHSASLLMLVYFIAGLGFVPLVVRASYRFGKHVALIGCCAFYVVAPPISLLLPKGDLLAAAGLMVLLGLNVGGAGVLFRSIMADVADADELATGQRRTGLLFAFLSLTRKGSSALAVGASFGALQALGFSPQGGNAPAKIGHLTLLFAALPMICNAAAIVLMWRFPLDAAAHRATREALAARNAP